MEQELFEALDLNNGARLVWFRAWSYVNIDDLTRVVNAGRGQSAERSFKLRYSTMHSNYLHID